MESYLEGFIVIVTVILAILSTMFLFLYTYGKCKEEASVFKMLRAVGMSATDIRIMVFIEILVRVLIAIFNGIVLGVIFSLGLSGQI
jgi:ABC-type antimicrobial peptide transport system permease subunit